MSERDFEVGAKKFKLNKINSFDQFHIVRRLGPILGDLLPVAAALSKSKAAPIVDGEMSKEQAALFAPIFTGFAKLSDEDANKILLGLCSAVEVFQPTSNSWARVARPQTGMMFDDIELPVLMQIAGRAFMYNMAGFFALMPQVSHGEK